MNLHDRQSNMTLTAARTALLVVALAAAGIVLGDEQTKTVLGPDNRDLYEGANALMAGDGEEGVRLTLRGLETATNFKQLKTAHANLCAGFVLLRQASAALPHCDWVIERDPENWRTYNNRALAYLALDRYEEAAADIERGLEIRPGSANLKTVKGMHLDATQPVTPNVEIDDRRDAMDDADAVAPE